MKKYNIRQVHFNMSTAGNALGLMTCPELGQAG
jgi:hypothetical protein